MKKILITGGTGFVGSNIVKYYLNKANYNITVIDKTIKEHNKFNNVEYLEFNLINHNFLNEFFKDQEFDIIFHQAAIVDTLYDNDNIFDINSYSIDSLIKLVNKSDGKLIYASSCAVYGNSQIPNIVNHDENPLNKYGHSKLLQDNIVRKYINDNNRTQIIGLRYSNIYGPGESHKKNMASMIYQINDNIKNNKQINLFEYGEQKRDFIYIDDIVNYNINSVYLDNSGIYNAGNGNSYSFNEVINNFELFYNKKFDINYIKNPYTFYQNHTLTNVDHLNYKPIFNLKDGMFDYLTVLNT